MMVLALFFAAANLECGLAPLEHGLLCGLAHVGIGPRQCAATPILPYVASVGVEMVSGTPSARVCACVVATEAEVAISGILVVFEWRAAMVIVSVGHMLMNSGDVLKVPFPCLFCDDAENMRSSCVCGYHRGDDSCSPDCSIGALNLLAVSSCVYRFLSLDGAENTCSSCVCEFLHVEDRSSQDCSIIALNLLVVFACVYRFQPFVMCFQPFVLPVLRVASSISRRRRTCVKGTGKDCKGEKEPICFQAGKIEAQALSLIQAESSIALESAELEERQNLPLILLGTTSGMPSLLSVQSTSSKQQLHLVPAGPSQKNWKQQTSSDKSPLLPNRSSSACTTKSPAGSGLPAWQSPWVHRSGSGSATWSCSPTLPSCMVQLLDVPVPQPVGQLVEVLRLIDTVVPEQVVDMPKITSQDVIPQRAVLRVPQMAEQLVDEPVPSFDDFELVEVGEEEEEQPHMVPGTRVWDAEGHAWCWVVGPAGVYWWRIGSSIAQWTTPDRLRTMSSISGPGINAFSWGRGCKGWSKLEETEKVWGMVVPECP